MLHIFQSNLFLHRYLLCLRFLRRWSEPQKITDSPLFVSRVIRTGKLPENAEAMSGYVKDSLALEHMRSAQQGDVDVARGEFNDVVACSLVSTGLG